MHVRHVFAPAWERPAGRKAVGGLLSPANAEGSFRPMTSGSADGDNVAFPPSHSALYASDLDGIQAGWRRLRTMALAAPMKAHLAYWWEGLRLWLELASLDDQP